MKSRSKIYQNGFISSEDDEDIDDLDLVGTKKIEDNSFIQVVQREKGRRINLQMVHPKDPKSINLFKFYLKNEDYDQMMGLIRSHRDIIIFIDGSSRNNPGKAGAGISFFGRKTFDHKSQISENNPIVDISADGSGYDSIFDILATERKNSIMNE